MIELRRTRPDPKQRDRTGEQRGRLTFVRRAGTDRATGRSYWEVACQCGARFIMRIDSQQKSCGCLNLERVGKMHEKVPRRLIDLWGRVVSVREAAGMLGLNRRNVYYRLERGLPLDAPLRRGGARRRGFLASMKYRRTRYGTEGATPMPAGHRVTFDTTEGFAARDELLANYGKWLVPGQRELIERAEAGTIRIRRTASRTYVILEIKGGRITYEARTAREPA